MVCEGDYYLEVLDKEVRVIKQVRVLSSDLIKPKYHATYVLVSNEPRTVRVRYACSDETGERSPRNRNRKIHGETNHATTGNHNTLFMRH